MDEATFRFLEELADDIRMVTDWEGTFEVNCVDVDDLNDLLAEHLPNLRYQEVPVHEEFVETKWQLMIVPTPKERGEG